MTPQELHVLQHACGLDQYGQGTWYRNYYVAGFGHHSYDTCSLLTALGLMQRRGASPITGGDECFVVTDAGKRAIREHSPKPPKLTRSQKRYLEWLNSGASDVGMSFGAWLKRNRRAA